jgi:ribosomal protein L18
MRESSDGTNLAAQRKRSLADDLRMRREIKERLSIERVNKQINSTIVDQESPNEIIAAAKSHKPIQIDKSGTALRIRP